MSGCRNKSGLKVAKGGSGCGLSCWIQPKVNKQQSRTALARADQTGRANLIPRDAWQDTASVPATRLSRAGVHFPRQEEREFSEAHRQNFDTTASSFWMIARQ